MRHAMIDLAAASEGFVARKRELEGDPRRNALDRRMALNESLTGNHGRAWARANEVIARERKKIKAERAALVVKDHDFAGVDSLAKLAQVLVAEGRQKESREYLHTLSPQNRRDITVSKQERAEIERAARGVWHSPFGPTAEEPPVKWQSDFRTREYSTGRRRK